MLRSVSIMILGLLLIGSVYAQDDATAPETRPSNTLACSVSLPFMAACYYERASFSFWNIELAYGADVRFYPDPYLAPYAVLGFYESNYAVVAELFMPEIQGIPVIGRPGTVFSVSTIYRW